MKGKTEIDAPNNEIAIIPKSWFVNMERFFPLWKKVKLNNGSFNKKKHHIGALAAGALEKGNLIHLSLVKRLQN